jgi:hypothetical protein
VRAPAEGMLVNHDKVVYSPGSHHFLLYDTPYEEFPTETLNGTALEFLDEETGVFDCSAGVTFDFTVSNLIGGSQNAAGDSMIDLPPGVGVRVRPNAVLLMNAHYINTTGGDIEPNVDITLHTIPEAELVEEGGVLFFYNIFIKVPGQSTAHATARCPIPEDITITNAQSHMHARGVDYLAEILEGDARTELYSGNAWQEVPVRRHEGGMHVAGGSSLEFTCHYDNPEEHVIYQGPRSTDEMCMAIASYYPAKPHVSLCSGLESDPQVTNFMGAEWVGQGTETCNTSLGCFQTAVSSGPSGPIDVLQRVSECVVASDPDVAPELSDAIGCTLSAFISGNNPFEDCTAAYGACGAK